MLVILLLQKVNPNVLRKVKQKSAADKVKKLQYKVSDSDYGIASETLRRLLVQ